MLRSDFDDPIQVPRSPAAPWIQILFWIFMLSFAFDYRAGDGGGSGLFQFAFLGLSLCTTGGLVLLGWRTLLVRPAAWVLWGWALFLAFNTANSLLQSVPPGRFLRIVLPFALCFAGMLNAHIAACAGLRISQIANPIFVAAIINILWRMTHGFVFKEVNLDTARVEILSPALNWSAAWIGCAILLRSRFHWTLVLALGCLITAVLLSVTRGLLLPILASAVATFVCFGIGLVLGVFRLADLRRRLFPIGMALGIGIMGIAAAGVLHPPLLKRWQERLFSPTDDRNMASDPSLLTRKAEAKAIITILNKDPVHYLHGHGIGDSFYWDQEYFPELYMVYSVAELDEISRDIWYAGHSVWTYALFSGGVIGLAAFAGLFASTVVLSLRSAAANARLPGPDYWLLFLPTVATFCLLSESATSNAFDERLLGILFGATFGLAQAGFIRASWIPAETASRPPSA
jgi:hypothetical protein